MMAWNLFMLSELPLPSNSTAYTLHSGKKIDKRFIFECSAVLLGYLNGDDWRIFSIQFFAIEFNVQWNTV